MAKRKTEDYLPNSSKKSKTNSILNFFNNVVSLPNFSIYRIDDNDFMYIILHDIYPTHYFTKLSDISSFIHNLCIQNNIHHDLHNYLNVYPTLMNSFINYFRDNVKKLNVNRHIISFYNGIYLISVHQFVNYHNFNIVMDQDSMIYHNINFTYYNNCNWLDIPTPLFDSLIN